MAWIAILALAIWVFVERERTSKLERELSELRRRLADAPPTASQARPAVARIAPAPITPAMTAASEAALAARLAATTATAAPARPTPAPPPMPLAAPRRPAVTRPVIEKWLAENGLAWIGGSALVVGGAFLVGFMASHGYFTPAMRILAAVVLGLALLGAGETVRRRPLAGFGRNRLAAAILSGAGAAMLYATCWASGQLYHFIDGATCGALLAVIAWSLLGLAFLHGEALAGLALGGAFAAPLIAGGDAWSIDALTLYLGVLIAAGAVVAWLRQWSGAAWTNLAGAAIWSTLAAVQSDSLKCLLIGLEPLVVLAGLAYALPRPPRHWVGFGASLVASLAALVSLGVAYSGGHPVLAGVIAAVALPLGVAALQRRGHAPAWVLAGPGLAFTLAVALARFEGRHAPTLTSLWCLQVLALNAASLWAAWQGERRAMSGVGALSSLALALMAGVGIGAGSLAPIAPAVACAALALGALRLATDRGKPAEQRVLEIWGGASAAALLATLALGLSWRWTAIGFALATVGLALIGRRLTWRSISLAAAAAAGLGFASLLTPTMLTHALTGGAGAAYLLGCALVVAVASFGAARIVAHETSAAEALRTLSPLAALVGAFIFLRWLAGGAGGAHLDGLTEASLRTFLIADAGLASLARLGVETTQFARWRGHLLMFAAAAHGLFFQVLLFNPRLGLFGDLAGGVPLLNTLALAYLAPALVFGLAAARIYRRELGLGRAYALIALFFGLIWAFLEIRRLLHGPHLSGGFLTIGAGEAVGCSLVLLMLAAVAHRVMARGAADAHPLRRDAAALATTLRLVAVTYTLLLAEIWSNPWWGAADAPLGGLAALIGVLAGYALVAALTARLAMDARSGGKPWEAAILGAAAIVFGVVLVALAVRAGFHGPDLTADAGVGQLEIWSYSAVGAVLGLAFIGVSRRGGPMFLRAGLALLLATTAKVFILDTASLSGVVRAGSFLALGALLLAGALTARRIAGAAKAAEVERV